MRARMPCATRARRWPTCAPAASRARPCCGPESGGLAMQLRFLGATGTVTGSRYLVEHEGRRLLVDCGLFQGLKALRLRSWAPLPLPAGSIAAVVLTHAHIDHSGWLPRL